MHIADNLSKHFNILTSVIMTPIGKISLLVENQQLLALNFLSKKDSTKIKIHPEAKQFVEDLEHYFQNPNYKFKQTIHLNGSLFQLNIWHSLLKIPAGVTHTYGDLAKKKQTSPRAVGQACRTNPIPIFVPCHRIVSAKGIGGFAGRTSGDWLKVKKWLLKHEGYLS